jgi:hypothetical protein
MTLMAVKKSVNVSKQAKTEAFETISENPAVQIVTSNRWSLDYRQEDQTELQHVEVDPEHRQ